MRKTPKQTKTPSPPLFLTKLIFFSFFLSEAMQTYYRKYRQAEEHKEKSILHPFISNYFLSASINSFCSSSVCINELIFFNKMDSYWRNYLVTYYNFSNSTYIFFKLNLLLIPHFTLTNDRRNNCLNINYKTKTAQKKLWKILKIGHKMT